VGIAQLFPAGRNGFGSRWWYGRASDPQPLEFRLRHVLRWSGLGSRRRRSDASLSRSAVLRVHVRASFRLSLWSFCVEGGGIWLLRSQVRWASSLDAVSLLVSYSTGGRASSVCFAPSLDPSRKGLLMTSRKSLGLVSALILAASAGSAFAADIPITLPVPAADIAGGVVTAGAALLVALIPIVLGFKFVRKFMKRAGSSV